jgi:hypothetical protein
MRRNREPHWIRHTHLFEADEYECSCCGAVFAQKYPACPNCGISPGQEREEQDWVEEAEELDWLLDDDD